MTHQVLRRAAAVLAVAAVVAVAVAPAPRPAAAQPPGMSAELKLVPADAAVFGHVEFAAVWDSKLGDTLRAAKANDIERGLAELKKLTGVTPDMIRTVTGYFPNLKQPGDFSSVALLFTFRKPYDRAAVAAGLKEALKDQKDAKFEDKDGVLTVQPDPKENFKIRFHAGDPNRLWVFFNPDEKAGQPQPAGADGPLTPAIRAAAGGATATLGINFANLPDEIRGDDVPAEVRPFQPLFKSDALIATARLAGDAVKLELRFRSQDKAKTAEAEKSLAAGSTLLQALLGLGLKELETSKNEDGKALLPLAKEALAVLESAKVSVDGPDAVAQVTVRSDLPAGPFLQAAFGGRTGPVAAASDRAKTQNNLKQIGLALHNYHDTYGAFPPAALVDKKGKPILSWRVLVLPFIEQDALYKEFNLDEPWDSEHNKKVLEKHPLPPVYALPGVTKAGEKTTHFQVFTGKGALFDTVIGTKIPAVTDGTSNTIMGVLGAKAVPWTKPDDVEFDPKADPRTLLHYQGTGTSVLFADGSVRYIVKTIAEDVLKALITKDGGEVIPDF